MVKLSVFLLSLLQVAQFAMGEERLATIRGTLKENGLPILDATVYLQSLDNEDCANLFNNEARDRRSAAKLSSCMHDVGTTNVDATGSYQFIELKAGWYAVHFLWNIKEKPSPFPASIVEGHWRSLYAGHKDSTGKYDSMAQDSPIYVAPGSEIQRDFDRRYIAQEPKPLLGRLSLPTKNWGVVLDLPGFTLRVVETKPDGRRYMVAENETTHVVVSLTLEEIQNGSSENSCHESLEKRTKNSPMKIQDVRFSHPGDTNIMEYMVAEFGGQHFNQKSMFVCQFHDNTYIDLHVSKVSYVAADEPLFASVLSSMHLDSVQRSSLEFMQEGSRLYLKHDYRGAIGQYSQALELEKIDSKLEKPFWYVLVDNLGMSYGITGDLKKAKETFEYGASKDPGYPLFYYNLACTYAEMGDVTEASNYLKQAFEHKANILAGETMPDPRKDDSFKKLMKNRDFRQLAETLMQSR